MDSKLSALVALAGTGTAPGDLFYVDDVSATTAGSKSVRADGMLTAITNATALPSGAVVPNVLIVQQAGGTPGATQATFTHGGTAFRIENSAIASSECGIWLGFGGNTNYYDSQSNHVFRTTGGATQLQLPAIGGLVVPQIGGTPGTDQVEISHDGTSGVLINRDGVLNVRSSNVDFRNVASSDRCNLNFKAGTADNYVLVGNIELSAPGWRGDQIGLGSGGIVGWGAGASGAQTLDTSLARVAAAVAGMTSGQWFQLPGDSIVASPLTNATATPSVITGLSSPLIAGRKYGFRLVLKCSEDQATEGVRFDLDGGTATVTSLAAHSFQQAGGTVVLGNQVSSALATDFVFTTITGETWIVIEGALVCNAAGTFIPRFAQSTHAAGTVTLAANSTMRLWDIA